MFDIVKKYLQSHTPALLLSGVHSSMITQVVILADDTPYLVKVFQEMAESYSIFSTEKEYFIAHRSLGDKGTLRLKRGRCLVKYMDMYLFIDISLCPAQYRGDHGPSITIRFLTRDREKFTALIAHHTPESLMSNRLVDFSEDHRGGSRTLGYIGQRFKTQEQFVSDEIYTEMDMRINRMISDHNWYHERNLPLKETFLLYGPPGTGKTSIIRHMAAKYEMDIHTVSPDNMQRLNDGSEKYRIILLEDIDSCRYLLKEEFQLKQSPYVDHDDHNRPRPRQGGYVDVGTVEGEAVSNRPHPRYSAFINALDGIVSLDRCIVIITTNYPERIIPSVLRKGRVDFKFHFDHPEIDFVIKKMGWSGRETRSKFIKETYNKGDIVVGMLPELKFAKNVDEIKAIVNQINTFE